MTIAADFDPVEYSFHFQHDDGRFVWRKDRHEGHEDDLGCREHIHDNAKDEDDRKAFQIVELDEVLEQIAEYHESQ